MRKQFIVVRSSITASKWPVSGNFVASNQSVGPAKELPIKISPSIGLLINKPVSCVWFSDYSALYLECGALSPGRLRRDGSVGNPVGEITVYLGFEWLIKQDGSLFKSDTRPVPIQSIVGRLSGVIIISGGLCAKRKNLELVFTQSSNLATLSIDANNPEWSVSFNAPLLGHLSICNGKLAHK